MQVPSDNARDVANHLQQEPPQGLNSFVLAGAHGGRRKRPRVFTEYGAIMAASILNSPRAVQMSVYVVRAFVRLREVLASNTTLARLDRLFLQAR